MPMQLLISGLNAVLLILPAILLVPILTFVLECVASLLPAPRNRRSRANEQLTSSTPFSLAVLVPAHNEADEIRASLRSLIGQVPNREQIIVIADNCTDATAEIARSYGVTVIERFEPNQKLRGKGYALDFGLRYLASNPPEIVATVDGDCVVAPGTIARIANQAYQTGKPVQSTYLMSPPANPSLKDHISSLAVIVKNQVRPLGLSRLGLPNLLTGSGMAFPWSVLQKVSLAGSKTCDDMQTSIDLAIAGYPTTYCPQTQVVGRLMEKKSAFNQRSRWEHGHLEMFTTQIPRLVKASLRQRRFDLFALALEIAIPPLALLVMVWFAVTAIALTYGVLTQFWLPVIALSVQGALLTVAVLGAWWKFGRSSGLSFWQMLGIPFYALWKIPLYVGYLLKPQTRWMRTERD